MRPLLCERDLSDMAVVVIRNSGCEKNRNHPSTEATIALSCQLEFDILYFKNGNQTSKSALALSWGFLPPQFCCRCSTNNAARSPYPLPSRFELSGRCHYRKPALAVSLVNNSGMGSIGYNVSYDCRLLSVMLIMPVVFCCIDIFADNVLSIR